VLAIVELGGYPNFAALYRRLGATVEWANSQRQALAALKRRWPTVIVAEYNFQSDFRDRTSNLETLMARVQLRPEARVICFYLPEHQAKLAQLSARFPVFAALSLPVAEAQFEDTLRRALAGRESTPADRA